MINKLFCLWVFGIAATAAVSAPRRGGELGNGRSVSYPILGIKTVRPDRWSDFENSGTVRIFKEDNFVILEFAQQSGLRSREDLVTFVKARFSPEPSPESIKVFQNSKLLFAAAHDEVHGLRGCAWQPLSHKHLCFEAKATDQNAPTVRMILEKLDFIEDSSP